MKIKAYYYGKLVYIIGFYTSKDGMLYAIFYKKDKRYKANEISTDIYFRFTIIDEEDENEKN